VNLRLTELYDYDTLRNEREATMYVVRAERAMIVLGSAQSIGILDAPRVGNTTSASSRRRRSRSRAT
jgi:hypothetical protein